jgi:hypothetical protein
MLARVGHIDHRNEPLPLPFDHRDAPPRAPRHWWASELFNTVPAFLF